MAHPYHHALSSVKKWGGSTRSYQPIHDWFDESKSHMADFRHRALRHHSEGIFMAEKILGAVIVNSDGRAVSSPVSSANSTCRKTSAEFHLLTTGSGQIKPQSWMYGNRISIERELAAAEAAEEEEEENAETHAHS
jgi:hypothetical protein